MPTNHSELEDTVKFVPPLRESEERECEGEHVEEILVSLAVFSAILPVPALDKDDLRQKVLDASHSTRINDLDMKPWHLKVNLKLGDGSGQRPETGTIEEWWNGLTVWTMRIESPSYTGSIIENRDGNFRTQGVGPIPLRIRAIEQAIVYPMPMGEDLSRTVWAADSHSVPKILL